MKRLVSMKHLATLNRLIGFALALAILAGCAPEFSPLAAAGFAEEPSEAEEPADDADLSGEEGMPDPEEFLDEEDDSDVEADEAEAEADEAEEPAPVQAAPVQEGEQQVVVDEALDADAVKSLQMDLIERGYLSGTADGVMGPATLEAIRKAQQELGLPVTGCISDELVTALQEGVFPLRLKSRGSLVLEIQQPLYLWGFLKEKPTGYYGDSTQEAVESFQRFSLKEAVVYMQKKADEEFASLNLPADVPYDQPLITEESIPCDGIMTEDWYHFLFDEYKFPRITAKKNDEGEDVRMVQKRLHALKYLRTGMDGKFGSSTVLALKYFQYKNGLEETGVCDDKTSSKLFSKSAKRSEDYVMPYMAVVNRAKSRVYIYGWNGRGYKKKVKAFRCSCGAPATPTLKGKFYAIGPISEWYYMASSNVWVRYAFQIKGNYFFHSVLFSYRGDPTPTSTSLHNLGKNVSHGCIRLAVNDVKWIYKHCTKGMIVKII